MPSVSQPWYCSMTAAACLLLLGPKGEGGLDDATGAGGSGGGASMKQSSGAVDLGQCWARLVPSSSRAAWPALMDSCHSDMTGLVT
jgi:hypothetical protein